MLTKLCFGFLMVTSVSVYSAELIEFKQTGIAVNGSYTGVGCGTGVMSGVALNLELPKALCAMLSVDTNSITQVTANVNSMYSCPSNSAILLLSNDNSFIVCGKIENASINTTNPASVFSDYRNDVPACPSGHVLTGLSLQNELAICQTIHFMPQ